MRTILAFALSLLAVACTRSIDAAPEPFVSEHRMTLDAATAWCADNGGVLATGEEYDLALDTFSVSLHEFGWIDLESASTTQTHHVLAHDGSIYPVTTNFEAPAICLTYASSSSIAH